MLLHNSGVNVKIDGLLLNYLKQRKKYNFCQETVTWDSIQWSIICLKNRLYYWPEVSHFTIVCIILFINFSIWIRMLWMHKINKTKIRMHKLAPYSHWTVFWTVFYKQYFDYNTWIAMLNKFTVFSRKKIMN